MDLGDREKDELVLEIERLRRHIAKLEELSADKDNLIQKTSLFANIFESSMVGIFQATPEGRFLRVNPALAKIHGFSSPDEMIDGVMDIGEQLYVDPGERKSYMELLEKTDTITGLETMLYRRDKTTTWISMNIRAVRRPDGPVAYYEGIVEDITGRKQAEALLKQSEEKYRLIFENVVEGIFQTEPEGLFISVNPAMARIHGFGSPEEMMRYVTNIGEQLYVDPEDRKRYRADLQERGAVRDFEARVYRKDGSIIWTSVNSKAVRGPSGNILRFEGTAEDITDRKKYEEELKRSARKLRKNLAGTIQVISMMLETRDPYTAGHQKRVSNLARSIAQEMNVSSDMADIIRMAGSIHDIGKMSVPGDILSRPAKLNDVEIQLIRVHPRTGYDILKVADLPHPMAEIVLQHHERLDGSGYPQGLKKGEILLEAQIISVADVIEAMISHRPYRPALTLTVALEEIEKNTTTLYHPEVVEVCLRLFRKKGFTFE